MSDTRLDEAIRDSLRRVRWVGALTIGLPPFVYGFLILFLTVAVHWQGVLESRNEMESWLRAVAVVVLLSALPVAWLVQNLLARRVASRAPLLPQRAHNLSAAGIVSLTVVHTPAVMALVYFLLVGDMALSVAMEFAAFLIYVPMQWYIERQIRALL